MQLNLGIITTVIYGNQENLAFILENLLNKRNECLSDVCLRLNDFKTLMRQNIFKLIVWKEKSFITAFNNNNI